MSISKWFPFCKGAQERSSREEKPLVYLGSMLVALACKASTSCVLFSLLQTTKLTVTFFWPWFARTMANDEWWLLTFLCVSPLPSMRPHCPLVGVEGREALSDLVERRQHHSCSHLSEQQPAVIEALHTNISSCQDSSVFVEGVAILGVGRKV